MQLVQGRPGTDEVIVAQFKHLAVPDENATLKEGRPVFKDLEVVEIRTPGGKDVKIFPALARSHWDANPFTGEMTPVTYAERFKQQYQQFKAHAAQTKSGTPLDYASFLTEARRAELRAQNVYTVEQLAAIDGQELKNLGGGGRDLKNAAVEYLAEAKAGASNKQLEAELEALRAKNTLLEEDAKRRAELDAAKKLDDPATTDFDEMTSDQLREYITSHTGVAPTGSLSHKTLKRIALEAQPSKAA
jgi:hypothetical protein